MQVDCRISTESQTYSSQIKGMVPESFRGESSTTGNAERDAMGASTNNSSVFFAVMNGGDRLSVDIDAEDDKVTQFKWIVAGETYEMSGPIDDEFYLNISNPQITYEALVTYRYGPDGELIGSDEEPADGSLLDGDSNEEKRDGKDDSRTPMVIPWGWLLLGVGSIILIYVIVKSRAKTDGGGGE